LIGTGNGIQLDPLSGEEIVNPTGTGVNYRYGKNGAARFTVTAAIILFIGLFFIF